MRRYLTLLLSAAAVAVLALVLAVPAFAEEAGSHESDSHESAGTDAVAEDGGFGTGQWDGLLLAAAGGVILGILAFASSNPGGIGASHGEHAAH